MCYFSATQANNKATIYYALMLLGDTRGDRGSEGHPTLCKKGIRGHGELGDGGTIYFGGRKLINRRRYTIYT